MSKKLISSVMVVVLMVVMTIPVLATTGYSSGSTKVMNSLNGLESAQSTITVSPYDTKAQASTVEVNVTVSSGSSSFYIIIEDPNGTRKEKLVSSSTKFTLTDFSGVDANGKWKVSIRTNGTVSTATATLKVNYTY